MKIGILGNMNNMYFSLARFLADEGYDCDLMIYDYEPAHFHPTADSFRTQFSFGIRQLNWGDPANFLQKKREDIEADLAPYDFLIGNGSAPAFLHRIGRRLDLFMPYGDDLYALPFPRVVHPKRQLAYLALAWHQRKGIQETPFVLFDKTNPAFEKLIDRLRLKGNRIVVPAPLFYLREYEQTPPGAHPYKTLLEQLRLENDLLILQHIRQLWKKHPDVWTQKGNDQLIRGYASFLKNHPGVRAKLLLFEYGIDINASKELIRELGIEDHVLWFPKMERKHLISFIKTSDLVVGELFHSWNSYCVVAETLAFGKVLMHKRNAADFQDVYEEDYPMIHASTAEEVERGLHSALLQKGSMREMEEGGRRWFQRYYIDKPLAFIKEIISKKERAHA